MFRDDITCLLDMLLAARRVLKYAQGSDFDQFEHDEILQDAIMRRIQVIADEAQKISPEFRDAHPEIPWHEIISRRNRSLLDMLLATRKGLRYARGLDPEQLEQNQVLQDALIQRIQEIGEGVRKISPEFKDAHLHDMLLAARGVLHQTQGLDPDQLDQDKVLPEAVMRRMQIVGEAARKISPEFKGAHPEIINRILSEKVWDVVMKDIAKLIALIGPLVPPDHS